MTSQPRLRIAQACVVVVLAGSFALLACETPVPSQLSEQDADLMLAEGVYGDTVVDQPPQRISSPPLEYPRLLQEAGIEGSVLLSAIVGVDGKIEVGSVEILESTNEAFELPSKSLLERSLFRPGKVDGEPVRTRINLPIQFVLRSKSHDEIPEPPEGGVGVTGVERS